MQRRREFSYYLMVVVVVGVCSLTAFAQFPRDRQPGASLPRIVSGNDVGFRVDGTDPRTGNPTGIWMIRVNGNWVEVGALTGIRPAK